MSSTFDLNDAHSATEAAALLRSHAGHAQPIAAGGDLLGLLKEDVCGPALPRPAVVINLASAPGLAAVAVRGDGALRIGAMARLSALQRDARMPLLLHEAIAHIASPQLRARTTIGGNLLQRPRCAYFRHPDVDDCFKKGGRSCPAAGGPAEAYPGAIATDGPCHAGHPSDLATALTALDAEAGISGPAATRTMAVADLYEGAARRAGRESVLAGDEVLAALTIPARSRAAAQAFAKVAPREANEFSTAAAAVVVGTAHGRVVALRIALGGVTPAPLLLTAADALAAGRRADDIDARPFAAAVVPAATARTAHPEAIAWRAAAARLAVERALASALNRTLAGG